MISLLNKRQPLGTWLICGFLMIMFYAGCKNENLIRPGDSIPVAYKKSLKLYRAERYRDAGKAFETVISSARGTDYARSALYFEAESYFKSDQYILAADAYKRFISLYPKSPKHEMAAYKEGLSYYKLSPRYTIDQKYTRRSIEKFRIFLSRFPKSQHADDAGRYLTKMRSKLAHKNLEAAELYLRLDEYKSAIVYYNLTVNQYPESSWAEQALVRLIDTYVEYAGKSIQSSKRDRYQKAVKTYEKYLQLFPDGKHRQKAEAKVDDARSALASLGAIPDKKQSASADQ